MDKEFLIEYQQSTIGETNIDLDIVDKTKRLEEARKGCKGCTVIKSCFKYKESLFLLYIEICPCRSCLIKSMCTACECYYLRLIYKELF
ncbi:MAG: hypothetical protein ACFFG0_03935 [Candidatus Thorarchaeota archaeon]